jgi:hypothetical protein
MEAALPYYRQVLSQERRGIGRNFIKSLAYASTPLCLLLACIITGLTLLLTVNINFTNQNLQDSNFNDPTVSQRKTFIAGLSPFNGGASQVLPNATTLGMPIPDLTVKSYRSSKAIEAGSYKSFSDSPNGIFSVSAYSGANTVYVNNVSFLLAFCSKSGCNSIDSFSTVDKSAAFVSYGGEWYTFCQPLGVI